MMILNLVLPNAPDDLLSIEVEDDVTALLDLVKALTDMPDPQLYFGQVRLQAPGTISASGAADNDVILVRKPVAADDSRIQQLAQRIRQQMHGPQIDPDSAEGQQAILQAIQRTNVQRNLEEATMSMPESFVNVTMLYVELKVNGVQTQAFVDCGAQATIISKAMAEKCNLHHLIDTRYQGVARGVGQAKICGRVHKTTIEAGGVEFDASFMVLEESPLLFGLDLLYRHHCCIDLKKRVLRIADIVELPFLDASKIHALKDEGEQQGQQQHS